MQRLSYEQCRAALTPDRDTGAIETGANMTLTVAIAALLIAQAIQIGANSIAESIDRVHGNN